MRLSEPGEHVEGNREQLQRQKNQDQVVGHPHEHHAADREHHQVVELATLQIGPIEVVHRKENGEGTGKQDDGIDEVAEIIDQNHRGAVLRGKGTPAVTPEEERVNKGGPVTDQTRPADPVFFLFGQE